MKQILTAVVIVFGVCLVVAGAVTLLNARSSTSSAALATPTLPAPLAGPAPTAEPVAEAAATAPAEALATSAAPPIVSVTPEDDSVNVRSGPGTQYRVVTRLVNDTTAVVIGRTAAGDWFQIEQGWVNAEVVLITGDATTVPVVDVEAPAASLGTGVRFVDESAG